MRLLNSLHIIIKAALLYYRQFVKDLKSISFDLNLCDLCFTSKMVRGEQLKVVWHLDDLKFSHCGTAVVTKMNEWLKNT